MASAGFWFFFGGVYVGEEACVSCGRMLMKIDELMQ